MTNLISKLFGKPLPVRVEPARTKQGFPQGYDIVEWCKHPELAIALKKAFSEELFRLFLAVLYNEIPSGYPRRGEQLNDTMAAIELGRVQGHLNLLNLIQSMTITPVQKDVPEQNYGADNINE